MSGKKKCRCGADDKHAGICVETRGRAPANGSGAGVPFRDVRILALQTALRDALVLAKGFVVPGETPRQSIERLERVLGDEVKS